MEKLRELASQIKEHTLTVLIGVLAIVTSSYLAAVYLAADARRLGERTLALDFRARALWTAVVAGALALGATMLGRFSTGLRPEVVSMVCAATAGLVQSLRPGTSVGGARRRGDRSRLWRSRSRRACLPGSRPTRRRPAGRRSSPL